MKRILSLCIICTLIISLCACSSKKSEKEDETIPSSIQSQADEILDDLCQDGLGAWSKANQKELSQEDQEIFDQATSDLDGASYEAIELLATQVVSGKNLCYLAKLTLTTYPVATKYSMVYIYQDLSGNATISEVVDLENE